MGLFDDIKAKVFGSGNVTSTPAPEAVADAKAIDAAVAAGLAAIGLSPDGKPLPETKVASAAAEPAPATGGQTVDVAAILDAAVAGTGQKLNWKTSIVDLLKALDLDSSLSARKSLAAELGYTGDTGDSAAMNIWLHKQVIQKLKDNGGKVPADLL